jgi:hypothetical protein
MIVAIDGIRPLLEVEAVKTNEGGLGGRTSLVVANVEGV